MIIEDDPAIRSALAKALGRRGHVVSTAGDGSTGLKEVWAVDPDVVLLDLMLPDIPGTQVLQMLRGSSAVPIIIATARDEDAEIVRLLRAGADDYVVKPFSADQIDARIGAVLRRVATGGPSEIVVGPLVIDPRAHTVTLDGRPIELTPKEFDLLRYLAERNGAVVSKRELLAEVWRMPYGGADKTVDVHLSWLRRKLGENAQQPRFLHTLRGAGIKLAAPEA
jgi:DNA-binding response OmpR family regulator